MATEKGSLPQKMYKEPCKEYQNTETIYIIKKFTFLSQPLIKQKQCMAHVKTSSYKLSSA